MHSRFLSEALLRAFHGRSRKLIILGVLLISATYLFVSGAAGNHSDWSSWRRPFRPTKWRLQCSPEDYAGGRWIHRPYYAREGPLTKTYHLGTGFDISDESDTSASTKRIQNMTKPEDVFTFNRFEGCASSKDYWWHLAANKPEQYDRFPGPAEWEWAPGGRCAHADPSDGLRDWDAEEVIRELIQGGGWLFIGDSVTENQFFALSCLLYPHVVATPDFNHLTVEADRAWPQHLYLNPASPLAQSHNGDGSDAIEFPPGFNVSSTPLVTVRRVDLLYSKEDLKKMHRELRPGFYEGAASGSEFVLFGDEPVWTISPADYFSIFQQHNYATMIVSTAGHWTTNLFRGYHLEGNPKPASEAGSAVKPVLGYDGLITFFAEVMDRWARDIQNRIDAANRREEPESSMRGNGKRALRKVLVRAYLPGHEDCHSHRTPWTEVQPFEWYWWNWREVSRFNDAFQRILGRRVEYPDIHYLPIDRPARLRPDAHSTGDCLHIMAGAGVLEGWSHYMWHFITREI